MRKAIVVRAEQAALDRPKCFLVSPFDHEFQRLWDDLRHAANAAGLQFVNTREQKSSQSFIIDIREGIRSAAIVVAICTPEGTEAATEAFNPNVYYEVGLAHALGKPTILLVRDQGTLPADMYSRTFFAYADTEIGTDNLRSKLYIEIDTLLQRMKKEQRVVTDPSEVFVNESGHWGVLDPRLLDDYVEALQLVDDIHSILVSLRSLVETWQQELENAARKDVDAAQKQEMLSDKWHGLRRDYATMMGGTWAKLPHLLEQASKRLESLAGSGSSDAIRNAQDESRNTDMRVRHELLPILDNCLSSDDAPADIVDQIGQARRKAKAAAQNSALWFQAMSRVLVPGAEDTDA